jgi:hypothetical protein
MFHPRMILSEAEFHCWNNSGVKKISDPPLCFGRGVDTCVVPASCVACPCVAAKRWNAAVAVGALAALVPSAGMICVGK